MIARLSRVWNIILRVATIGAWVFAVGSLLTLVLIACLHWPGTDSTSHIMAVSVDGKSVAGPGFNYVGIPGTALVITEALVVLAGIALSIMPQDKLRRIGHVQLVLWAGLWLTNAVYVTRFEFSVLWALVIALFAFFFACTIVRAVRCWRSAASGGQGTTGGGRGG